MDEQEVQRQQQQQNINQQEQTTSTDGTTQKTNDTGLPEAMKTFVEASSGLFLDEVRVHYNSPKPAENNLTIYSEGTNIYVSPNAEDQLEQEVWVVVRRMRQQENDTKRQTQLECIVLKKVDRDVEHLY